MQTTVKRTVTVDRTPRFMQICGKFDLPTDATSVQTWDVDVQLPAEWSVGVIVGPSMSGKTTLARELFGPETVIERWADWPADRCIADGFPADLSIDTITGALSSVGFSSPPDWKKPYAALSNGGKFRVDLARTRAERPTLAVMDEFGSLTHAQARNVAAAAIGKDVRRNGGKFVALCLYEEMIPYFEPDWVINVQPGEKVCCQHTRGLLRRPDIRMDVRRVDKSAWQLFRHHHYLAHDLHRGSKCFVGFVDGQPAAFTAVLSFPHPRKPAWREHRTVCVPDFQGVGIGNRMSEFVASLFKATGKPYLSTTSHPAMIRHRARSPLWAMTRKPALASARHGGKGTGMGDTTSSTRITAGFQYVGPARADEAKGFGLFPLPPKG